MGTGGICTHHVIDFKSIRQVRVFLYILHGSRAEGRRVIEGRQRLITELGFFILARPTRKLSVCDIDLTLSCANYNMG